LSSPPRILWGERYFGKDNGNTFNELAIWDRALSEDEIQAIYNSGNGVEIPVE
jgi:hypothetical protein